MQWMDTHLPVGGKVLVLEGRSWVVSRVSEWLPALTHQVSVGSVQGTEWLAGKEFSKRTESYARLQKCLHGKSSCLNHVIESENTEFDFIYLPSSADGAYLSEKLVSSGQYAVLYSSKSGDSIFEKLPRRV